MHSMGYTLSRARMLAQYLGPLAGCASFSPDGGLDKVAAIVDEHQGLPPRTLKTGQDATRAADEVRQLLSEPISAEGAVKIAILNNRDPMLPATVASTQEPPGPHPQRGGHRSGRQVRGRRKMNIPGHIRTDLHASQGRSSPRDQRGYRYP